jgi:hypothetical protein
MCLYAMLPLPRIRITDLLSEVARWRFFTTASSVCGR